MLKCKDCGTEAYLLNGEVVKKCECTCGVEAEIEAVAYGNGSLK
jgi:hypothetical protein